MLISIPYLGKTTFLYWLLLHRLENRLPTAVQTSSEEYFIFDEQGAICHSTKHKDSRLEKCWALVDSNAKVHQPCDRFLNTAYRVIQASSPKAQRWKEWIKQKRGQRITSDLPSVPEIAVIVSVGLVLICWISLLTKRLYRKELGYNPSSTLTLVRKWGPCTRNIIRSMEAELNHVADPVEKEVRVAVEYVCQNSRTIFGASVHKANLPEQGSSVVFIRRKPKALGGSMEDLAESIIFIPTPHIINILDKHHSEMENLQTVIEPGFMT